MRCKIKVFQLDVVSHGAIHTYWIPRFVPLADYEVDAHTMDNANVDAAFCGTCCSCISDLIENPNARAHTYMRPCGSFSVMANSNGIQVQSPPSNDVDSTKHRKGKSNYGQIEYRLRFAAARSIHCVFFFVQMNKFSIFFFLRFAQNV